MRIDGVNGDGASHDLALPDLAAQTPLGIRKGRTVGVTFTAMSTLDTLDVGSGIFMLGMGLAALALASLQE